MPAAGKGALMVQLHHPRGGQNFFTDDGGLGTISDLLDLLRQDWWDDAACRGSDPDLFWPSRGGPEDVRAEAKAVCATCTVQPTCLEEHLWEKGGIWGGTGPRERMKERKRREREGIPMKMPTYGLDGVRQ